MHLGLVAPLSETTVASSLTTLRTSNGDVIDSHVTVEWNGVVRGRRRVNPLAGSGIARGDNRRGSVTNYKIENESKLNVEDDRM